jgi:hypothetical protein
MELHDVLSQALVRAVAACAESVLKTASKRERLAMAAL